MRKMLLVAGLMAVTVLGASAQTDATTIVTAASTAFTAVATLCVSIGTFFIVYKLVRKVK